MLNKKIFLGFVGMFLSISTGEA